MTGFIKARLAFIAILSGLASVAPRAIAQTTSTNSVDAGARPTDFDLNFGTILPNSKTGLDDTVPGWGLRALFPAGRGGIEISGFLGRGNSIVYRSLVLDYRFDFDIESLNTHLLIGLNGDSFSQDQPTQLTKNFATGLNMGGGASLDLAGPIFLRGDFLYRIGPGQELEITVGLGYHWDGRLF